MIPAKRKKLLKMSGPDFVSTDSGWNWSPMVGWIFVPQRHDQSVARARTHGQRVGKTSIVDDERMIAARSKA